MLPPRARAARSGCAHRRCSKVRAPRQAAFMPSGLAFQRASFPVGSLLLTGDGALEPGRIRLLIASDMYIQYITNKYYSFKFRVCQVLP